MQSEGKASERKYPDDAELTKRPRLSTTTPLSQPPPISSLSTASPDVVRSILACLGHSDLVRVFPCSRFLATFQRDDFLWSALLTSRFLTPRPPLPPSYTPDPSPYILFRQYHAEFPPLYHPHYSAIHGLHQRLRALLEERAPWIAQSVRPGVSEAEVEGAVRAHDEGVGRTGGWLRSGVGSLRTSGCVDWLLFLKMMNGQHKMRKGDRGTWWVGLLGTIRYYHTVVNLRLSDMEEALAGCLAMSGCVPISSAPLGNDHFRFYLQPTGQVVRSTDAIPRWHVVAPSFTAFLTTHVERLQSGLYEIKDPARVPRGVAAGISRFAFPDPCGSDCVTRGIRVQASVLFLCEESDAQHYFFTYRIRVTHTGETSLDATLTTRRWIITSGGGQEKVVEGEGVIGLYPHIFPGCEPFEYESLCDVEAPHGSMRGSFFFATERTGESVEVTVAPFTFDTQRNGC